MSPIRPCLRNEDRTCQVEMPYCRRFQAVREGVTAEVLSELTLRTVVAGLSLHSSTEQAPIRHQAFSEPAIHVAIFPLALAKPEYRLAATPQTPFFARPVTFGIQGCALSSRKTPAKDQSASSVRTAPSRQQYRPGQALRTNLADLLSGSTPEPARQASRASAFSAFRVKS